ncbi:MAG: hypothetical protein J0L57_18435 [Burkholderiales bacterium]|nr:hypothetical protein [Burkholderiales bacterium]
MRIVLWSLFVVVALTWTGGAALLAQAVQWSAQGIAAGTGASLPALDAASALPAWLAAWIDPAAWQAALTTLAQAWAALSGWLPALSAAVGWLEPAIWIVWGLGLAALLVLTGLATWLIGRLTRPLSDAPA